MKIEYKKLETEDLELLTQLIKVYETVFEMEDFTLPAAEYLQSLLEKRQFGIRINKRNLAPGL